MLTLIVQLFSLKHIINKTISNYSVTSLKLNMKGLAKGMLLVIVQDCVIQYNSVPLEFKFIAFNECKINLRFSVDLGGDIHIERLIKKSEGKVK